MALGRRVASENDRSVSVKFDRLVSAQETTPEDIDLAWREASAEDDEKLLEMQLCVLLSDIVCLKERERFFRAA